MARKLFFSLKLAVLPILIGLIVWLELKRPFSGFRLATLTLVFFLLVYLATIIAGKTRDFIIVLAALAFGLSIAEGVANLGKRGASLNITRGWAVRQPIMGWGPE